jgi:hypothetical protein
MHSAQGSVMTLDWIVMPVVQKNNLLSTVQLEGRPQKPKSMNKA